MAKNSVCKELDDVLEPSSVHPLMQSSPVNLKTITRKPEMDIKKAAFSMLVENGASVSRAAQAVGIARNTGLQVVQKMNSYEAARDRLLKKSVKTLNKIVAGQPFGGFTDPKTGELKGQIIPKCSTVMRGIECIMDREAPKITFNASMNSTTVELLGVDEYV